MASYTELLNPLEFPGDRSIFFLMRQMWASEQGPLTRKTKPDQKLGTLGPNPNPQKKEERLEIDHAYVMKPSCKKKKEKKRKREKE